MRQTPPHSAYNRYVEPSRHVLNRDVSHDTVQPNPRKCTKATTGVPAEVVHACAAARAVVEALVVRRGGGHIGLAVLAREAGEAAAARLALVGAFLEVVLAEPRLAVLVLGVEVVRELYLSLIHI